MKCKLSITTLNNFLNKIYSRESRLQVQGAGKGGWCVNLHKQCISSQQWTHCDVETNKLCHSTFFLKLPVSRRCLYRDQQPTNVTRVNPADDIEVWHSCSIPARFSLATSQNNWFSRSIKYLPCHFYIIQWMFIDMKKYNIFVTHLYFFLLN